MSFIENWIDQGKAPSVNAVLAAIDQGGIGAVNIYMGGRFAYLGGPNGPNGGNGWTPTFVQSIAAARPVGFFGSWVSLSPGQGGYNLGFSDGLDAALAALSYPMVRWLSYDVEPGAFDANPQGAADAMRGFTDAVHSKGFLSMPYSVPRGLAAGSQNADAIWIANPNPGGDDPAVQPLPVDFFAGKRSVQCCLLIAAGVDWDLSHSQFSIGADMTPDEMQARLDAIATAPGQTGFGPTIQAILSTIQATYNAVGGADAHVQAVKAELDTVEQQVASAQPVNLTALKAAVDALSKHLGVGTP